MRIIGPTQDKIKVKPFVLRRTTKIIKWLEILCYEDRMREFRQFILEKRRIQGDLIAAYGGMGVGWVLDLDDL